MRDLACRCKGYGCTECLAAHPEGRTCADCAHYRFCRGYMQREGTETACDWIPSRFHPWPIPTTAEVAS